MINYKKENYVTERNRLVEENYRLVPHFAKKYVDYGVDFDELCSLGAMGLIRAAACFDSSRGTKFSTYAFYWIKQAITRGISKERNIIHVPSEQIAKLPEFDVTRERIRQIENKAISKIRRSPRMRRMLKETF